MVFDIKEIVECHNAALSNDYKSQEVLEAAIKSCSGDIRRTTSILSNATTTTSRKSQLIAAIGVLKGIRSKLKIELQTLKKNGGSLAHPNRSNWISSRVKWEDIKSVFQGRIRTGCIVNLQHKDPIEFLQDCGPMFVRRITNILKKETFLKANSVFCGKFVKMAGDVEIEELKYLNTKNESISRDTNTVEWFGDNVLNKLTAELDEFQERDSGWALKEVINLIININKYTPQVGSSYIELPLQIKRKEACVNVQNDDDACFAWAIVSALYPAADHPHRVTKYPHFSTVLKLDGISFPIARPNIGKFEKMNNVSVNVYALEREKEQYKVVPTRLTTNKQEKHVNLLLVQDHYDKENYTLNHTPIRYHYAWIKNLSRLVSRQLSHHHEKKYFCDRCLHYFYSEVKLQRHLEDCKKLNNYRVAFPSQNSVKFENYKNKERVPFVIYSDFECILKPVSKKTGNTEKYQQHEAHSVGYYVKCAYDSSQSYYRSYRGADCAKWFAKELENVAASVDNILKNPQTMDPLTEDQLEHFNMSTNCHICAKRFTSDQVKVRDHCHLTGRYRGPAHQGCNLNYKDARTIPVVFHNLSNYDAHLLIRDVSNSIEGRIKIIPNNTEKYISMVKYMEGCEVRFKFIDSFRFMASSLDKLASYLDEKDILRSQFPDLCEEKFQLLTRKGVFPYEHISSWSSLEETRLPDIKCFYSSLQESAITRKDYEHAQRIWTEFGIQNLGEYSDLYLKTDVLLLADIFENFREVCVTNYALDPAHYYTAPGLAWDAMLKVTGVELDLIHDIDIQMFVEKGIRGGLTQCSKRHAKANNKYMEEYNPEQPSTFLMYYELLGLMGQTLRNKKKLF